MAKTALKICGILLCISGIGGWILYCYAPWSNLLLLFISSIFVVFGLYLCRKKRAFPSQKEKDRKRNAEDAKELQKMSEETAMIWESISAGNNMTAKDIREYKEFIAQKADFICLESKSGNGKFMYSSCGTYICIDENDGQPYLIATRGSGVAMGDFALSDAEQEILDGSPRKITYDELASLAGRRYSGVEEKLHGINETNWKDYLAVIQEAHAQSLRSNRSRIS